MIYCNLFEYFGKNIIFIEISEFKFLTSIVPTTMSFTLILVKLKN